MISNNISLCFDPDPKLKDVTFEYFVNGKKLSSQQLTSTSINRVFGSNEFSVAGSYPENEEINEVQVIIKSQEKIKDTISFKPCGSITTQTHRCIPKVSTDMKLSSTEMFVERIWAFKRINFLLTPGGKECSQVDRTINIEKKYSCIQEALRLALKYNFVTDLTSLVIEETNNYIKKGPVQINLNPKFVKTTPKIPANTSRPTQSRPSTFPKKGPVQINQSPKLVNTTPKIPANTFPSSTSTSTIRPYIRNLLNRNSSSNPTFKSDLRPIVAYDRFLGFGGVEPDKPKKEKDSEIGKRFG